MKHCKEWEELVSTLLFRSNYRHMRHGPIGRAPNTPSTSWGDIGKINESKEANLTPFRKKRLWFMYHIVSPKNIEKYIILHHFGDILLLFYLFGEYYLGVSINRGTPIAGWFIRENPSINGWFAGTPFRKAPYRDWSNQASPQQLSGLDTQLQFTRGKCATTLAQQRSLHVE